MQDGDHTTPTPPEVTNERLPGKVRPSGRRSNLMLAGLLLFVCGMFGFAYANAEFFVMICQRVGLIAPDAASLQTAAVTDRPAGRPLEVYFSANVANGLPIAFTVDKRFQKTNVNAPQINDYRFTNLSRETIYFRPVHDVYPTKAGLTGTLELLKCFCFDEQMIEPGQSYTLPVEYIFNETLPDNVHVIRMNYTLFPSTRQAYEASLAAANAADGKGAP